MANFQIITCPDCNGSGCPTCNNTGKVKVAPDQMQKLKQMVTDLPMGFNPQAMPAPTQLAQNSNTNLAGIIAFSLLSVLAGSAAASWWFLKTLRPFFAGFISTLLLAGSYLASQQPFFKKSEPNDFLKAIKKT